MDLIGILTLSSTDDTPAFAAFRQGLSAHYKEGTNVSLHFQFASNESELPTLGNLLTRIPVDVLVTGGTKALNAVSGAGIPIVHLGDQVPTAANTTGFSIDAVATCKAQLDKLATFKPTWVTVLVDDPTNSNDPTKNTVYVALQSYATATYPGLQFKPLTVSTRNQLKALKPTDVNETFMIIPNGMFYAESGFVASLVDGTAIKRIFPEREYKDAQKHPAHSWVHGHNIPTTFRKAAEHVYRFLATLPMQPPTSADADVDAFP
jgi:hypothetical protein